MDIIRFYAFFNSEKSEVHSIYQFFDIFGFHASLTDEEVDKISG